MKFDWLLDLVPAESATPALNGVAPSVARTMAVRGCARTTVDEVPHLPHLPHPKNSRTANEADLLGDLAEHLTERAAILEHDSGLHRAHADVTAVRIVQCSACLHWTADPLGGGGIGTCATDADATSRSARDGRPRPPWPAAPRYCTVWQATTGRQADTT